MNERPEWLHQVIRDSEELIRGREREKLAKEEEKRTKERIEQWKSGHCTLIPCPKLASQPFRSELTVEQNSLFVANDYRENFFTREWIVTHPESGESIKRCVTVGKLWTKGRERGVLTQVHQDVFYQLLQLWDNRGYPVGKIGDKIIGYLKLSAYDLVTTLRKNSHSAGDYRRVQELLQDLASIPIVIENSYTWYGLRDREQFTLLGEIRWDEKSTDQEGDSKDEDLPMTGEGEVMILLSSRVTEGFLHKHIKTLLGAPYEVLMEPSANKPIEIARLLYPFLDGQLSTKDEYHSCLAALAERFALRVYPHKSRRQQQFTKAVQALNGKPILGERYVLEVHMQLAVDKKDYLLVAKRRQPNFA